MDITIRPRPLAGSLAAIPSKSQAHRLLICAAFADQPTHILCPEINRDIQATVDCLRALGTDIRATGDGFTVTKASPRRCCTLDCHESGSTLRFMLPVCGALGVDATFLMAGRLPQRPLSPLWEEMERMGCALSRPDGQSIRCTGALRPGSYRVRGDVSSQFVTGLLFALSVLDGESQLILMENVESLPYIQMTLDALETFGVRIPHDTHHYTIVPQSFRSPGRLQVEGDWSNGAFWLAANSLGSRIELTGLSADSPQGDRGVVDCLKKLEHNCVIDASQIPDLVPVLAVAAGAREGTRFTGTHRLRIKESDRLVTTAELIRNLGGRAELEGDELLVYGTGYTGGSVDAAGDHRIAMAAAVAATVCSRPVTVLGAEAVSKSYPAFWADYQKLGGQI